MAQFAGLYNEVLLRVTSSGAVPVISATATVYEADGVTLATLYTDATKSTTTANPTAPDARGNLAFYADPGRYVVEVRQAGVLINTFDADVPYSPSEVIEAAQIAFDIDGRVTTVETFVAAAPAAANIQSTSAKGQAGGYAPLDGAGLVPAVHAPSVAVRHDGTLAPGDLLRVKSVNPVVVEKAPRLVGPVPNSLTLAYETCVRPVDVATSAFAQPSSSGQLWQQYPNFGTPDYSPLFQWDIAGGMTYHGGGSGVGKALLYLIDRTVIGNRSIVASVGRTEQAHWGVRIVIAYLNATNHVSLLFASGSLTLTVVTNGVATDVTSIAPAANDTKYLEAMDALEPFAVVRRAHPNASPSSRVIDFGCNVGATQLLASTWPVTVAVFDQFFGATVQTRTGIGAHAFPGRLFSYELSEV